MGGKNPPTGARKNIFQKLDLDLPLELQIQDCPEFGYNQKINSDLQLSSSRVYNIFVNEKGKKSFTSTSWGEKFRLKNKNLILNLTPNE